MSTRALMFSFFFFVATAGSAHAAVIYSQPDDSGEMVSQQATFQNTWIESAALGNLYLGKGPLTLTFTIKDPNAGNTYHNPQSVVLESCQGCQDLQRYDFTDADRTLISDGAFHTFTVQTGTTTLGLADGATPIYVRFVNLSQYRNSTHLKSNAAGTIPAFTIEADPLPTPPPPPEPPAGVVMLYSQSDDTGVMTNPQATYQNSYIDSASLGNLVLGQDKLYLSFTMRDPHAGASLPIGVCLQPATGHDCGVRLQTYYFTAADRTLLADGAWHSFMVETGTTTNSYADGTQPVSIGFFGLSQWQYNTKLKSNADTTIPLLTIYEPGTATSTPDIPPDPVATSTPQASNVMFLPGIEGSRLYEGVGCGKSAEEKLWEPIDGVWSIIRGAGDRKVGDLALDAAGESVCVDIYTKKGDIIDATMAGNLYQSLIDEMNSLVATGTMSAWEAVAYDWRLSLDDLLAKGAERAGKIYYEEATSTPYIEQTLRALAAHSKTGKVTIIAHSNGGLVTKALLAKIGDAEAASLVDKIILVGSPQAGAPTDVASLLVGYGAGIYADVGNVKGVITIVSNTAARTFMQNSPMAYHLLPSEAYFNSTSGDAEHPVARFSGTAYAKEISAYGSSITNQAELDDFLLAREGGRIDPSPIDLRSAEIVNAALVAYTNTAHATIDAWVPPSGIEVYQIAGWGVDTVAGIDFYSAVPPLAGPLAAVDRTGLDVEKKYRPIFIEDGDGTVPVPSALMIASGENVNRYWINLHSYNKLTSSKRKHGDIFEVPSLEEFLKDLIENSTGTLPSYISATQPPPVADNKKLIFSLHSPLTLQLTDSSGNVTGLASDDSIEEGIPGSTYGEFGEVKYIIAPAGGSYELTMRGQESGTFSLDIQESEGGVIVASTTIANVPVTLATLASLTISSGVSDASPLTVDVAGDGSSVITLPPAAGQTVLYEPPVTEEESAPPVVGGGAGGAPPVYSRDDKKREATTTESVATSTRTVATTSPDIVATTSIESAPSALALATSTESVVSVKPVAVRAKRAQAQEASVEPESVARVSQIASAYEASQQPLIKQIGKAVYTKLYSLWSAVTNFFHLK